MLMQAVGCYVIVGAPFVYLLLTLKTLRRANLMFAPMTVLGYIRVDMRYCNGGKCQMYQ